MVLVRFWKCYIKVFYCRYWNSNESEIKRFKNLNDTERGFGVEIFPVVRIYVVRTMESKCYSRWKKMRKVARGLNADRLWQRMVSTKGNGETSNYSKWGAEADNNRRNAVTCETVQGLILLSDCLKSSNDASQLGTQNGNKRSDRITVVFLLKKIFNKWVDWLVVLLQQTCTFH